MYDNHSVTVNIEIPSRAIGVKVSGNAKDISTKVDKGLCPHTPYEGGYVFTPTSETQTVPTMDKVLLDNITINPIPNNYGLITYNGAFIRVS